MSLTGKTISQLPTLTSPLDSNALFVTEYGGTTYSLPYWQNYGVVTGFSFNINNYDLTLNGDKGLNLTQSLAILSSDMNIVSGSYNPTNGVATFVNNSGGTFNVMGFLTGYTDFYITGGSYSNGTLTLNQTNGPISISGFLTGTTSSSISGSSLPIVRYVYLVRDSSDAVRMGGTASNVYTTFQTAYDAANALQVALGGTNTVVILVGNTTAATVGNLTLTANYNRFVLIKGINLQSSILGNIIATNATGNGFNVGQTTAGVIITDVRIGTISTNATGPTGSSGSVSMNLNNVQLGNISTAITDPSNTTGSGGEVRTAVTTAALNTNNFIVFGNITTSSQGSTSSAGAVIIVGASFFFNQIITANGNLNGGVTLQARGNFFGSTVSISNVGGIQSSFSMQNGQINQLNLSIAGNISILEAVVGALTVFNTSPTFTPNTLTITGSRFTIKLASDFLTVITAKLSSFNSIEQVGDNSIISNCVFDGVDTLGLNATIEGIGPGCSIYNCTVLQGSLGIDNSSPVTVNGFGTIFVNGIGSNVTIV